MGKVDVVDWNNKKVGQVDLNAEVFEAPVRKDILHTVVKWQLACKRRGTHKAKTRAEVSGGGKKPFRQKGTGNARQGSTRSPLNEAGGVIFGPKPRDYSYHLPKKVRQAGLRSALSHLVKEGRLFVVEDMKSADGKTKEVAKSLQGLGLKKTLLVDAQVDEKFRRASRNIPSCVYYGADAVNVYDLLKFNAAVVTKGSLEKLEQRCGVRK